LILREAELCISLLLIPDDRDVEPIKLNGRFRLTHSLSQLSLILLILIRRLLNKYLVLHTSTSSGGLDLSDEKSRAETGILNLCMVHEYDQAVKLAGMWGLSYVPIIQAFTKTCIHLVYQVLPATGDLADYVRHLDISGNSLSLPSNNSAPALL